MSKIVLEVKDRKYTLEFSRATALDMERSGFTATEEFLSKPIMCAEMLFYGALQMHHPNMNANLARKIFADVEEVYDTSTLSKALIGFYGEAASPNVDMAVEKKQIHILED